MRLKNVSLVLLSTVCAAALLPAAAFAQEATELAPITVQGQTKEDPKAPVKGFVAKASSTATKTGTPILETQQSISVITADQLHLFAMIAEKAYGGDTHWLMFLFRCKKPIAALPPDITEGKFAFFSREQIKSLPIPETDKAALWPIFDQYHDGFVALKADCGVSPIKITVEQITATKA